MGSILFDGVAFGAHPRSGLDGFDLGLPDGDVDQDDSAASQRAFTRPNAR